MSEGPSPASTTDGGAPSFGTANPRVLHIVFVVDCSGSMTGERIGSLNWAARAAVPAMRDAAAEHPDVDVLVRVLRFADEVDWPVASAVPVDRFVWTTLTAGGESRMGAALSALAATLKELEGEAAQHLPPVIILLSDGLPTDDASEGVATLAASELGAKSVRIPIAIGPDADLDLLQAFSGDPSLKPLRANSAEMLVGRIRWATSVPIEASVRGAAVRMPADAAGEENEAHGGLLW